MTENNAAQPGQDAIRDAIRKAYDDGYNDAKMDPDGTSTYCGQAATKQGTAALLSKLRAEGVQAGAEEAAISGADVKEAALNSAKRRGPFDNLWQFDDLGLHIFASRILGLKAALASAPVAGEAQQPIGFVDPVYVAGRQRGMKWNAKIYDAPNEEATAPLYAAPQASEAQCSCPSGDGSLRHPCAVHPQASEAVRDGGMAALGDVVLPPLPAACIESRQTDSTMRTTVLHTYDEQDMKVYAYDAVVVDRQRDAIAWESTTPAYIKFITDSRYRKLSVKVREWYRPYRCATCAALSAQPGAQKNGGSDA